MALQEMKKVLQNICRTPVRSRFILLCVLKTCMLFFVSGKPSAGFDWTMTICKVPEQTSIPRPACMHDTGHNAHLVGFFLYPFPPFNPSSSSSSQGVDMCGRDPAGGSEIYPARDAEGSHTHAVSVLPPPGEPMDAQERPDRFCRNQHEPERAGRFLTR